jgi:hypothetical protein
MGFLSRLVICVACIIMLSCNSMTSSLQSKNTQNQCMQVCFKHLDFCKQHCDNNCRRCSRTATIEARNDYVKYLHEIKIRGGILTRGLNSYRDPLQCRKVTCNCASDFNTCKQGCTGIIHKKLQAIPYCS